MLGVSEVQLSIVTLVTRDPGTPNPRGSYESSVMFCYELYPVLNDVTIYVIKIV